MSVYIRAQIARRRQELVDIERRALELKAELRAYEDALAHIDSSPTDPPASRSRRPTVVGGGQGKSLQATSSAIVIAAVRAYPGTISLDDAETAVADATGGPVKRPAVRT